MVFETKDFNKNINQVQQNVDSAAKTIDAKGIAINSVLQSAVAKGFDMVSSAAIDFAKSVVEVGINFD